MGAIVVENLSKHYGAVRAVDDLSFAVPAGRVTGFLGPNGAGKTTTLRVLLGLVHPTSGRATFGGTPYARLAAPARHVGAVLDAAASFHPGRRARDHLRILATAARIPLGRVDEVLSLVDLDGAASRRVGTFSLGMRQRLGLAGALLGDPAVLVLDEPANGLDPAGVRWMRALLRSLAREGRTVLVSSHLLAEVAQTVDDVVLISSGRLVTARPLAELDQLLPAGARGARIRTPAREDVSHALAQAGMAVTFDDDGSVVVTGASAADVGRAVARAGLVITELQPLEARLEDVFLELTGTNPERSRR